MNLDDQVFVLKGSELQAVAEGYLSAVLSYDGEGKIAEFWPTVLPMLLDQRLCTLGGRVTCGYALWNGSQTPCTLVCTLLDLRLCTL